jgi:hypothetical protein
MPEKTTQTKIPYSSHIPEETRQHIRSAHRELRDSIKSLLPPQFLEHRRKARKEMLLAWRSLIDTTLEHLEEHEVKAK